MRPTVFLILLLSTFSAMAQQSIIGRWNSGQENTVIEIKEIKGKVEGRIVSSDNTKAPIGRLILKGVFREEGYISGSLYSLRKGKWFDASFSPQSKNMEVTLTVGLISRKLSWKKIH
jgi:hypothetical protein